mmetsp:Transcript_33001/g.50489  ORF Transcript_33001/g.50489 Transcript_33001/m.50489 type:complete len:402 (+) Transcript_33001:41-1246(+)
MVKLSHTVHWLTYLSLIINSLAFIHPTGSFQQRKTILAATVETQSVEENVSKLKRVLYREYVTFFNPMKTEFYSGKVTFQDPMMSIEGVESYRGNVDMLAGRTLLGSILFEEAGIALHSIVGGKVTQSEGTVVEISDIITRWTLRMTAKVLPWKPTARFSGISVYKVQPGGPEGVLIIGQTDYWDSVNLQEGGKDYKPVEKSKAIGDFLDQLKPGGFQAQSAAPEVPYELLRRGQGYEIRRYPSYVGVKLPYGRRDEGFGSLGSFTRGMNPMAPAIMEVPYEETGNKMMMWPISYAAPGEDNPPEPKEALEKAGEGQWRTVKVQTIPSSVVAVAEFTDASMGPVVRKTERELRRVLKRDGLEPLAGTETAVKFAQYDAIFSMGKRRGEVWIELEDGTHPWC